MKYNAMLNPDKENYAYSVMVTLIYFHQRFSHRYFVQLRLRLRLLI